MVANMFQQLLFLFIIINAGMSLPCAPGEVTLPYTFTAKNSQQNVTVNWKRGSAHIATCPIETEKCSILIDTNMYEATRSGLLTTMQIKNVTTQSGGVYTCEDVNSQFFNCGFKIYAKPDSVICQDPEFRAATQDVAVVCKVQRIYPNPVCRFSWFIDNTTESQIIQKHLVEYKNLTGSESSSYFNQNCSFNVPARQFTLGKHQFQLTAYPNVTGQDSDAVYGNHSSPTFPKSLVNPVVTLQCLDTDVQEDKQVSCTCRETANTFILVTTTLFYGTEKISSALQNITANVKVNRHVIEIICQSQLPEGTETNKTQSLNVYFASTIFSFDVNSTSEQIIIERNSTVSFSCQAEGNPSPSLSLRKNGTELQQFNDSTHNFNLTLTYNMIMSKCLDTGVYMCHAGNGQTTTNKTVTVYVKCMQQFTNPDNLRQINTGQVNDTVSINVSVFGYPEPNMTLISSKYTISSDAYNLTYIKQEPPYGTVSLIINIKNASFFQNYSVNINNAEGQLTYSFEIVERDPEPSGPETRRPPGQDVGAVVGGIVAAVLVIVIIFVIIFLLKRKGAPCKRKEHPYANTSRNGLNGSDESANASARKVDIGSRDQDVEIDNIVYNMDITVEIDNSDLYNMNCPDLVEIDNSDIYNMNRSELGNPNRESEYKSYSEVTPIIMSATSMPLNMRNKTEDTNPDEDVSAQNKNKPKPPAPQKPKPAERPKPQRGKQEGQKAKTAARDEIYATVVKVQKLDKPFVIKEDKDEFFADPSQQPEVPDKNFENPYEDTVNEKKSSDMKNNNADKPNGKAVKEHKASSSLAYTNNGFSNPEGEATV